MGLSFLLVLLFDKLIVYLLLLVIVLCFSPLAFSFANS